jgi:pimeloyl-ACP methyl ester carboxylesterase
MSCSPIHTWRVVIGGFLQDQGRPTGMVRLWQTLDAQLSRPGVRVELRNWNDNWRQIAELIWRVLPADGSVRVGIYAYSWGAGWGAMQLARRLSQRGVSVAHMVLSDPVYRSPWLPFRWLAFCPWRPIVVPRNVRKVIWYRQRRNRPAGHRLIAEDAGRTSIFPPDGHEADVIHAYMDDLLAFHRECERSAAC